MSAPCYQAYIMATLTVASSVVASFNAGIGFIIYYRILHTMPDKRFTSDTKYDVQSSSWLLILATMMGMCISIGVINNYLCGLECPAVVINCNTSTVQMAGYFTTSFGAVVASSLRIASFWHQLNCNTMKSIGQV